jgi:uncharacterized membrane protein YhiD involved in acid resistance
MTRSTKAWFEIAALTTTVAALLAIAALGLRLGDGLAITTSMFTAFFCVFMGIAVKRRRVRRRDPTIMSIKDELDLRKLRAKGEKVQFR